MAQADVDRRQARTLYEADGERIILDRHRPGRARARLAEHEVPVWALIGHMRDNGWDIGQTARDYALPVVAVQTALDFYRSDPVPIDALLTLNDDFFASFDPV